MTPDQRELLLARLRLLPREQQLAIFSTQVAEEASRLELSLRRYTEKAFPILEPENVFVSGWHLDAICEHLEAVSSGAIRNLVINMPPRHMKSLLVSVFWMTWEWTTKPWLRYLFASFNEDLAVRDSRKCRLVIESDWYQARWGARVHMAPDQNLKARFENTRTGLRMAAGTAGSQHGEGGDRIVVDDAHNPTPRSFSDEVREGTLQWWDQTMSTRYTNPQTVAKVIVGQRLHERDLPGYLLEKSSEWVHLNLPAEFRARKTTIEVEREARRPNPTAWNDPRSEEGELLWPERFGPEEIRQAKKDLGSYGYAAQFQQTPAPAGGGLLKREWWRFFREPPSVFDEVVQSWDLSFKDAATSSYVVGLVLGRVAGNVYVLACHRERLDFPETCRAIAAMTRRYPQAAAKLVEDKANGPAVIAQLRATIPGLIAVTPRGSKEARASAISPFAESGNVYLPDPSLPGNEWVEDFIAECAAFPKGAYNDQVDAFTQGMDRLLIAIEGEDQLIPHVAVESAIDREFVVERGWEKTLAVVGGRETVISLRYGPVIRQQWATNDLNDRESVAARVVELARTLHVHNVMVDVAGLGSALLATIRATLGAERCRGFNPEEKARRDDKYDDARTEVALALRDAFVYGKISIPNDPLLVAQLTAWRVGTSERGKAKILMDGAGALERAQSVLAAFAVERSAGAASGTPPWL